MKQSALAGIVLIVLGVLALTYHFTYTTRETIVDIGPIKATAERQKTLPIPPIVGAVMLAGGIALLVMGKRD